MAGHRAPRGPRRVDLLLLVGILILLAAALAALLTVPDLMRH